MTSEVNEVDGAQKRQVTSFSKRHVKSDITLLIEVIIGNQWSCHTFFTWKFQLLYKESRIDGNY